MGMYAGLCALSFESGWRGQAVTGGVHVRGDNTNFATWYPEYVMQIYSACLKCQ